MIINWSILSPRKDKADVEVSYSRMKTEGLTDTEIKECADLFSSSYGNYSKTSAVRPGKRLKWEPDITRRIIVNRDFM